MKAALALILVLVIALAAWPVIKIVAYSLLVGAIGGAWFYYKVR